MHVAEMLVDSTVSHEYLDGYYGYSLIFIGEEDVPKTGFQCPCVLGTYERIVMPFGLKNVEVTYQRAMNSMFHDFIETFMQVYIDDIVIKSSLENGHLGHFLTDLSKDEEIWILKMNPLKFAFYVRARDFLGFMVHKKGIEINQNKTKTIVDLKPPSMKKQLQYLLGKINFLRRFISNLNGKTQSFSPLLRLKKDNDFVWRNEQQKTFDNIK